MTIEHYIDILNKNYKSGNTAKETLRSDLQKLIENLLPDVSATYEPKRQACGAPDYILTKDDFPLGFIEAINLGEKDFEGNLQINNKKQFDRFKASLNNILFTNYLEFHLYREGQFISKIAIGEIQNNTVVALPENFTDFTYFLSDFCAHIGQTINSSRQLAEVLASKTKLLSEVIEKALIHDEANQENSSLSEQLTDYQSYLCKECSPQDFADNYALTIAFGMFAARLHDPSLPSFSRQEAAELIPKSNPFLHKLFTYLASPDIDDRIKWIVNNLTEVFLACNIAELLQNHAKATKTDDPISHFYETFLIDFNPKYRKARGVWYTPQPIVNFIVRAVDDILKTDFNLLDGLANTAGIKIQENVEINNNSAPNTQTEQKQETLGMHQVQIMDQVTNTGSFLAEVVNHVHKSFKEQNNTWSVYVETDLLPRLIGFEKQMANFTMAHLKLDYLLTKTNYKPSQEQRFQVYLTNSLVEPQLKPTTKFSDWLSEEASESNQIQQNAPICCVMGNLPFSSEFSDNNEWITKLLQDYKAGLDENEGGSDEEYITHIRYGQHIIDKSGSGVLAYVSDNSFIDEIKHRQMRKHLVESFDKIYILDLHGNVRKNEKTTDGSPDHNVLDVLPGVSINIFIKTGQKKAAELGKVFHFDLFGKKEYKYDFLNQNALQSINFKEVKLKAPLYFLVQKDYGRKEIYNQGFKIDDLFVANTAGVITEKNALVIGDEGHSFIDKIKGFFKKGLGETQKFLLEENGGWKLMAAQQSTADLSQSELIKIAYRPFDEKHIYYKKPEVNNNYKTKLPSKELSISLFLSRQLSSENYAHLFITDKLIVDTFISNKAKEKGYLFPLYVYPEANNTSDQEDKIGRKLNLNQEILNQIGQSLSLTFTSEEEVEGEVCFADSPAVRPEFKQTFSPQDILSYIYAVLHSPAYREKYKQFLKTDFPRVPYPKDSGKFWQLVKFGNELQQIHLLKSPAVENYITQFPVQGTNVVQKLRFDLRSDSSKVVKKLTHSSPDEINMALNSELPIGNVYINKTQYFAYVPVEAWNFCIGNYQPAQKWLKDRKGQALGFEEILHYQKIIVALSETARIMTEINKIEIEEPTVELIDN